ncbi:MAG: M1 family metallopeptidase [Bacillota bacterium]
MEKRKEATISMDFTVTIPKQKGRFGWHSSQVSLGNWFPILAVYDHHGWNLNPYFAEGESFYSLTSNFEVTIQIEESYTVAATGQRAKPIVKQDGMATYQFQAENVRDFAMVFNRDFNQNVGMVDGIQVNVFYADEDKDDVEAMLATANYVLPLFKDLFGEYPWDELDIISLDMGKESDLGMEYPQLIMVNTPAHSSVEAIYQTVEHETAHQWFYGAVGNDQYAEPWLDESFPTYASYVAFYETLDFSWVRKFGNKNYHLTSPVSTFTDREDEGGMGKYSDVIYDFGAKTLHDLHEKVGDELFYKGMKTYYRKMKFRVATTADFIRIMEEATNQDLTDFFREHRVFVEETM